MVETKAVSVGHNGPSKPKMTAQQAPLSTQQAAPVSSRTFGAGYIAPHPSIRQADSEQRSGAELHLPGCTGMVARKDAVDVDGFLLEHQVYTSEYLESVQPTHCIPSKWYELVAWYWHVLARTMIGLLTGTLGATDSLTEHGLARRILFFTSVGTVCSVAGAVCNHVRAMLWNRPDNGWVHTAMANAECVRTHSGIWSVLTGPPLLARLVQIFFQAAMLMQMVAVYALFPSVAHAYDAYRAEEQVFNYSQAVGLIDRGRFKRWQATPAPGLAVSYYALPEGAHVRDAVLRMRADEACIHHLNSVLAGMRPGDKNPFIVSERKTK